jgi:hypothetical protein
MDSNRLFRMYLWYCDFLECYLPFKPQYGNYYLRGKNSRYRRILNKNNFKRHKDYGNQ